MRSFLVKPNASNARGATLNYRVSVRGSAKSVDTRTFTHFNEFEKCRSEFGQSLTNFQEFVKHYSMRLSKLQGTAAPPSSVPLVPCSKSNMFNHLYVTYDL